MKVIVCGAGQVGFNIARHLAGEGNDVTVIDQGPDLIRKISDTLDVKGLVGFASHPDMLERAGASDSDMIIAVTFSDEVNMVACQISHSLFKVPTKIARVRQQSYLEPKWRDLFSRDNMPIDVIISPEIEVARAVMRRLQVPGAIDVIPFAGGRVSLVGVHCSADCPVVHTPLRQLTELFPDLGMLVVGIIRGDRIIVPSGDDHMVPGDDVYFTVDTDHMRRALAAFGHEEEEARRIIIVGGGNIGMFLAQQVEEHFPDVNLKIIEIDSEQAKKAADRLQRGVVLNGNALDREILDEANVSATETIVAVSNDDEVNVLSSLLAKRYGAKRAVTLINNSSYGPLVSSLGIDVVVNPRDVTVSTILQHVRRGRIRAVHNIREGLAEVIEAEALETSPLMGSPLREVKLPAGIIVGAIVRAEDVIIPNGDTVIQAKDRVIILAAAGQVKKVEKLFSVGLEFF
ncbi:MAG: Trk system potassium transporter TrkA [Proteobacteria bacterium]|nr:Trk system potassium transporter TrkA [Pseudomonadota bacterium]